MKICFVSSFFYGNEQMSFGAYPTIRNIILGVAEKAEVFVLANGWPKRPSADKADGLRVFRALSVPNDEFRLRTFPLAMKGLSVLRREKPDVINAQDIEGAPLFLLEKHFSKIPRVFSSKMLLQRFAGGLGNTEQPAFDRLKDSSRIFFENMCLNNCTEIVVPSQSEKTQTQKLSAKKITVIPNGVDAKQFAPARNAQKSGQKTVFFSGGHSFRKGAHVAVDAFINLKKDFPELRMVVVGSDFEKFRPKLEQNGLSLGTDVVAKPRVSHAELPALLNRCDIVLHPSYYETFGTILAEGMSCGKPVVASKVAAIPEVVGDAGMLCETGNSEQFTEAVRELLLDGKKAARLGRKGRERVLENFTIEKTVEKYLRLFKSLS